MSDKPRARLVNGGAAGSWKHYLRKRVLVPAGRGLGFPSIHISSPLTRGGNYLYYWLWAYTNSRQRHPYRVLHHAVIDDWLCEFPLLDRLTVKKTLSNRLLGEWIDSREHEFGEHFTREQLVHFSRALIDSSSSFKRRLLDVRQQMTIRTCVVNVRRGDYYENPDLTPVYGIDIERHVTEAVEIFARRGYRPDHFLLVSDDPAWCAEHLTRLLPGSCTTIEGRNSMFDDLAALAIAPAVILANSTFSFWGAFLGDSLDPERLVAAPPRHLVADDGTDYSATFDPKWLRTHAI